MNISGLFQTDNGALKWSKSRDEYLHAKYIEYHIVYSSQKGADYSRRLHGLANLTPTSKENGASRDGV